MQWHCNTFRYVAISNSPPLDRCCLIMFSQIWSAQASASAQSDLTPPPIQHTQHSASCQRRKIQQFTRTTQRGNLQLSTVNQPRNTHIAFPAVWQSGRRRAWCPRCGCWGRPTPASGRLTSSGQTPARASRGPRCWCSETWTSRPGGYTATPAAGVKPSST